MQFAKRLFGVVVATQLLLAVPAAAHPQAEKPANVPKKDAEETAKKPQQAAVFAFDTTAPDWAQVKRLLDDSVDNPTNREANLKQLAKATSQTRWVNAAPGHIVIVYSFFRGDSTAIARVKVDEKARELLVAEQFRDVLKVAQNLAGGQQTERAGEPLPIQLSLTPYVLELPRAEVQFTASIEKTDTNREPPKQDPRWVVVLDFTSGATPTNANTATITTLTGPREAWSISANVAVGQLKQLQLDDKAESFGLKDKPGSFFISFNYIPVGDAILPARRWRDAVQFLAMLKASNRPTDAYGLGIGLRPGVFGAKKAPSILQIFDTVTPFLAVTRTRVTGTNAAGQTEAGHRTDFVVGLSLDIKKGVEWTTKKKEGAKE